MKSLIHFDEFGKGMGFPSMREFFCDETYFGMDKIVEYLQNGRTTYVTAAECEDVFTNQRISGVRSGMTDGNYSWNNTLAYYVKKYNLKLDDDFIQYVLNKN